MPRDAPHVLRRLYTDCWAAGNFDLVPELLHPEIVWTAIESAPDAGTRRGYAECEAYMSDWIEAFDLEPHAIDPLGTAADGRLVCAQEAAATEKRSGLRTEIRYGATTRFANDGRILEIHEYASAEEALEAAGLPREQR